MGSAAENEKKRAGMLKSMGGFCYRMRKPYS